MTTTHTSEVTGALWAPFRTAVRAGSFVRHLAPARFAPLPLRLMLGITFLVHGMPKVFDPGARANFAHMLAGLNVPMPEVMAWVVGFAEAGCAALLLVGAFTVLAAGVLVVNMIVAAALVHAPAGFNMIHIVGMGPAGPIFGVPGYEVNLLIIAMLAALMLSGAGALSLDDEWERTKRATTAPGR
jgi:putative oxidoreductase